ncbi:MAG: hypothetical protein JWN57_2152 [Frankiales bacterium]|nr:hypothetical protein [Frankiales bacterium]
MTRTSTALKRLGVAGVAVVTMGAGLPLLLATPAQAASAAQVTITPEAKSGAANTCVTFTLDVADLAGNAPTDTTTVNVILTDPNASATNTASGFVGNSTSFCTVNASGVATSQTGNNISGTGQGLNETQQQFVVAPGQRQVTFGVFDTQAENVAIRGFLDNGAGVPANANNGRFDAGEPNDTATATFTAGGAAQNAANDAVRNITEQPLTGDDANPVVAGGNQMVDVILRNQAGDAVANAVPSFRVNTGGANSAGTTGNTAAPSGTCSASNNAGVSRCVVPVANPGTDTITIFVNQTTGATAGPDAGEPQLTVTRTTAQAPNTNVAQARNIDLTPEGPTETVSGTDRVFTARVSDATGRAVSDVEVYFYNQGSGTLTSAFGRTNNLGQITTTLRSAQGQVGQAVVVASIDQDQSAVAGNPGNNGQDTQCAAAAGTGGAPATSTSAAGNCSDAEVSNFVAAPSPSPSATTTSPSPSPSATNTVSPSPIASRLGISVSPATITPGIASVVTVTGTPGTTIELQAYSRPNTTYSVVRRGTILENGTLVFRVTPGTNTRLFAAVTGQTGNESPSAVINVRTALSLTVVRNGSRDYTFQGRILPRRAGQLITLYRVLDDGREIITSQINTDNTGTYRIRRVFTGSGTFGFLTRTGQTLTNAAGVSNEGRARPTSIYAGPQR